MKLSLETVARFYAAGRNYANMAIGFAAGAGVLSAAQDKTLTDALNEMATGIGLLVHGATSAYQVGVIVLGPLIGGVLAWMAQRSARNDNKAASLVASAKDATDPKAIEATIIVSNAAAAVPGTQKVVNPLIADNPATAANVVKS